MQKHPNLLRELIPNVNNNVSVVALTSVACRLSLIFYEYLKGRDVSVMTRGVKPRYIMSHDYTPPTQQHDPEATTIMMTRNASGLIAMCVVIYLPSIWGKKPSSEHP